MPEIGRIYILSLSGNSTSTQAENPDGGSGSGTTSTSSSTSSSNNRKSHSCLFDLDCEFYNCHATTYRLLPTNSLVVFFRKLRGLGNSFNTFYLCYVVIFLGSQGGAADRGWYYQS